jgi:hypothetical protein
VDEDQTGMSSLPCLSTGCVITTIHVQLTVAIYQSTVKGTPKGCLLNKRAGEKNLKWRVLKFQRAAFIFPKDGFLNLNGRVFYNSMGGKRYGRSTLANFKDIFLEL